MRVLLKLSGESLGGPEGRGVDSRSLVEYAHEIADAVRAGHQIAVVNGGGNIFRGLQGMGKGFDRITGDSLGPLVGHSLSKFSLSSTYIYGTLSSPVHALNLCETISEIDLLHPNSLIIAIDASLGVRSHLGYLTISKGALEPGLGVRKKLPPVGDISITGIVNSSGGFDHFNLQTTRLSTVVSMADAIVSGILMAHSQYFSAKYLESS